MINTMTINGYNATITFDPDMNLFRGGFLGLNGGADFYSDTVAGLQKEGEISLKVLLDMCKEDGVEPRKDYSGKFNVRIPPELHASIAAHAAAEGKSLNQWLIEVFDKSVAA